MNENELKDPWFTPEPRLNTFVCSAKEKVTFQLQSSVIPIFIYQINPQFYRCAFLAFG